MAKLTGKQKQLDKNNNNRIDKQDFELLRKSKMQSGGAVGFKNGGCVMKRTNQKVHMS